MPAQEVSALSQKVAEVGVRIMAAGIDVPRLREACLVSPASGRLAERPCPSSTPTNRRSGPRGGGALWAFMGVHTLIFGPLLQSAGVHIRSLI